MKDMEKEQLLDKLIDLMGMDRTREWKGTPYVDDDGTFGVMCGNKKGGLYAAYFLMDSLGRAGLMERGKQRTDLDTAMYELTLDKVFEPWKGARLFWDSEKELRVEINTDKPLNQIFAAIDKGIEAARAEHRASVRRDIEYQKERRADKERDRIPETFGPGIDEAFVKTYLSLRVENEFPGSLPGVKAGRRNPELEKALEDTRPIMVVEYDHPAGENYLRDNQFRDGLGKIFNGFCAVMGNQSRDDRMEFTITGSAARLAADIVEHDPDGARKTLTKMKSWMVGDKAAAEMQAVIDKHEKIQKARQEPKKSRKQNASP